MHAIWHWMLWVLAIGSHDPGQLEVERAHGAGCATVAYAAFAPEPEAPKPAPPKPRCRECDGSGKIFRSDGGYVRCACGACPDGRCQTPPGVLR